MNRAVREGRIGEPRTGTFLFQMPALANPAAEFPGWWGDAEHDGGWLGADLVRIVSRLGRTVRVGLSVYVVRWGNWIFKR